MKVNVNRGKKKNNNISFIPPIAPTFKNTKKSNKDVVQKIKNNSIPRQKRIPFRRFK